MPKYFEFEVALQDISPRIWRRFLLRSAATFKELHDAIQAAGPWENSHLWDFSEPGRGGRVIAGPLDDESGRPIPDAKRIKLASYFEEPDDTCLYRYDFGDDWEHEVRLERIVELPDSFRRRLLAGERAFPPEDCGGVPGYYECLAALGAPMPVGAGDDLPDPEDLEDRRDWLGDWTPEFDLEAARKRFDRIR
jgi:hypothetical protein